MVNTQTVDDTIAAFKQRASDARSIVHEMSDWHEVSALALELAGSGTIAVSSPVTEAWPGLLESIGERATPPGQDHAVTATAAVGIVRGALGIAETGSVLLVEEHSSDRAVSMLPPVVVQLLDHTDIRPTLDALLERVFAAPPTFASLTTGPSRTADIERALTIGVHGPHDVHVVILG